jgi:hypothetical protein
MSQVYYSICAPLPGLPQGDRFPYGICGPFLEDSEAESALCAIQRVLPDRELAIIKCQYFDEAPWLIEHQEAARAKLRDKTEVS